jgi:hypothetical protein
VVEYLLGKGATRGAMTIIKVPFFTERNRKGKRRQTEQALAMREYREQASAAYRDAIRRRDGSSGPASTLRVIPVIREESGEGN